MKRKDILALVRTLDQVGFESLEVWGGATFDSAFRFLKQSAWTNLREIRKAAPNTKLSMLLRGQNVVGYHHYDNDTLERFVRLTLENGIDIIRIFDALNDPNNLKFSFEFTKKYGGHLQAAIAYTISPVHNNEYYVNLVKTYESMGADSICIKDMAGIISPQTAYDLISDLKQATKLPIHLHSHTTANATPLVMEQAMLAGVDIVDGCISPFSGGTSHLADETLIEVAKLANRSVDLDMAALSDAYELADEIVNDYIASGDLRTRSLIPNPKILTYQVPGGMLSNLLSQLEQQGASDRFNEVLKKVPKCVKTWVIRPGHTYVADGRYPVRLNVLLGERYKMIPNEIKDYVQGLYGRAPGELDQDIVDYIMTKSEKKPTPPKICLMYTKRIKIMEEIFGARPKEEEVVAYSIFPEPVPGIL